MAEALLEMHRSLEKHGIVNPGNVYWNLTTAALYEEAIRRREGFLSHLGPLVVRTGQHTGRSPRDKYVVDDETTHDRVWWGESNQPMPPERFEALYHRLLAYLQGKDIFVQDLFAGADPKYRMPIRVITERAWHNLFARNLFIQPTPEELQGFEPRFTVIQVPGFTAVPEVGRDPQRRLRGPQLHPPAGPHRRHQLCGGDQEVHLHRPQLPPAPGAGALHALFGQPGKDGEVALFFGLSGTGKTTLSADPDRQLIGDDEHGWSDDGVFNFEGGCYAK